MKRFHFHFHFYHHETGVLHTDSIVVNGGDAMKVALANAPKDHLPIEGAFDPQCQRIDIATGKVVDYQPPAPSPDHEWNGDTKRWQVRADVAQRQARRASAQAQIVLLEASQHRPIRELRLDPTNASAAQRLEAIDNQIAALRKAME